MCRRGPAWQQPPALSLGPPVTPNTALGPWGWFAGGAPASSERCWFPLDLQLSPIITIAAELGGDAQAALLPPGAPQQPRGRASAAARCREDLPGAQRCSA